MVTFCKELKQTTGIIIPCNHSDIISPYSSAIQISMRRDMSTTPAIITFTEYARFRYLTEVGLWDGRSFMDLDLIVADTHISYLAPIKLNPAHPSRYTCFQDWQQEPCL